MEFHDKIEGRESLEWVNFWYSKSNEQRDDRILLIGDSTVRMIRSTFERLSNRPVDMIGTSSGLNDILFKAQYKAFFVSKKYQYKVIFLQIGHHSIINSEGKPYENIDYEIYKANYIDLINELSTHMGGAKIVLLTNFLNVTKVNHRLQKGLGGFLMRSYRHIFGEVIDESWSRTVRKKNEMVSEIAKENNIPFCDINSIMLNYGKKYVHVDHIHYQNKAKPVIVNEYMKYL